MKGKEGDCEYNQLNLAPWRMPPRLRYRRQHAQGLLFQPRRAPDAHTSPTDSTQKPVLLQQRQRTPLRRQRIPHARRVSTAGMSLALAPSLLHPCACPQPAGPGINAHRPLCLGSHTPLAHHHHLADRLQPVATHLHPNIPRRRARWARLRGV